MNIEVLISCMHQKDASIIKRSNIQSDVVVINQCDENREEKFEFKNKKGEICHARIIYTTDRGLSKSRNMALEVSCGDICLICDDDEILSDDYPCDITKSFEVDSDVDIIAFQISDSGKNFPKNKRNIGYIGALKLASWQLAFKRNSISNNNIKFDETLGSGVSKAGGEENKFVYDCLRKGLKIIFAPITIGRMIESESQWFHGFTPEYFFDRGIMTKKLMGRSLACLYAVYFIFKKYPLYRHDINMTSAINKLFRGIFARE